MGASGRRNPLPARHHALSRGGLVAPVGPGGPGRQLPGQRGGLLGCQTLSPVLQSQHRETDKKKEVALKESRRQAGFRRCRLGIAQKGWEKPATKRLGWEPVKPSNRIWPRRKPCSSCHQQWVMHMTSWETKSPVQVCGVDFQVVGGANMNAWAWAN